MPTQAVQPKHSEIKLTSQEQFLQTQTAEPQTQKAATLQRMLTQSRQALMTKTAMSLPHQDSIKFQAFVNQFESTSANDIASLTNQASQFIHDNASNN